MIVVSDSIAKAERSKAKDARQMPAPDSKPRRKAKKAKPWRVDYKWNIDKRRTFFGWMCEWSKFGSYRTKEEAETAVKNDERKNGWYDYRIRKVK